MRMRMMMMVPFLWGRDRVLGIKGLNAVALVRGMMNLQ